MLDEGADVGGALALDLVHGLDQLRVGQGPAQTPAGHAEALGQRADQGAGLGVGLEEPGQGARLGGLVDEVVVDLVGDDEDALAPGPFGQGGQALLGVVPARGVGGRAEDEDLDLGGPGPLQILHVQEEALFRGRGHEHGFAVGQEDHVRVAHPVGRGDEHLVAGIQQGHEEVVEHLLAAVGDDDVLLGGLGSVETAVGHGHGPAQSRDAGNRGVAGVPGVQGRLGGLDHVRGRGEVGLAHGQTDDLPSLGLELLGLGVDGQGGRGADARQSLGDVHGSDVLERCGFYPF